MDSIDAFLSSRGIRFKSKKRLWSRTSGLLWNCYEWRCEFKGRRHRLMKPAAKLITRFLWLSPLVPPTAIDVLQHLSLAELGTLLTATDAREIKCLIAYTLARNKAPQ